MRPQTITSEGDARVLWGDDRYFCGPCGGFHSVEDSCDAGDRPDAKPSIVEALAAVMSDVQAVRKGDKNTAQNYSFRGVDAVVNAVGPVLRKHGVVVLPSGTTAAYRDVTTSNGKPSRECTVTVRYRFYGPAGDYVEAEVPGESMDFGDKGAPKAMSVAYRIALLQALCIPTDDVDPDAQSYEREQPQPQRVTDPVWIEDFRQRLLLAANVTEVEALQVEAKRTWDDGRLTADDVQALRREMAERTAELTPAGVSA